MANLKTVTNAKLGAVLLANLAFLSLLARGSSIILAARGAGTQDLEELIPAGVAALVTGILNSQLSGDLKARIVFWRWDAPLPGSGAFSGLMHRDPRIDVSSIMHTYSPIPADPSEQNALWYKLYRTVSAEPAVLDAHSGYLFARDYASLMVLFIVVIWLVPAFTAISIRSTLIFCGVAAVQYALATRAARVRGERLVCTVLAIKGAEAQS